MSDLFNTGIRPAVDEYLLKKSKEKRDYGDYWGASSAGYCMKLNIMRRLGVPKVPELEDNATQTRIFEAGHIFHEWMQRITKDAGLSIAQEVELQDEDLMIRGHFDDLVLVNDKLILMDYKTQNSQAFNYKRPEMSHYHKMQLATYMYMLRNIDEIDGFGPSGHWPSYAPKDIEHLITMITESRILKISKDDLRLSEEQLMWSESLNKAVYGYWSTLNGYWKAYQDKGTLPACTCLDYEGGFMGKRSAKGKIYGDFFWDNEPCSTEWFNKWLEKEKVNGKRRIYRSNNGSK